MKRDINFSRKRLSEGAEFYAPKGITPQPYQIRVEANLVTGTGVYEFDIKKDASVKTSTEKTIRRNDLFVARAIAMALMCENDSAKGSAPLLTYPMQNSALLPTGIKGFANVNPYALYNGVLSQKTGQVVNFKGLPTSNFLKVPATQPGVYATGATLVATGDSIVPQFDIDQLLYELPELLVYAGTQDHTIKLEAPVASGLSLASDTGYTSKVVLIIDGWLYEGGTDAAYKVASNPYFDKI